MDTVNLVQVFLAFAFVLALIGASAWLMKRSGWAGIPKGKSGRLAIVEMMPIDIKRRLVIIKRDDTEHLILLAPEKDMVIETNIKRPNAS